MWCRRSTGKDVFRHKAITDHSHEHWTSATTFFDMKPADSKALSWGDSRLESCKERKHLIPHTLHACRFKCCCCKKELGIKDNEEAVEAYFKDLLFIFYGSG